MLVVLDKFRDAFKRLTSLRANEVNRASVAGLTEGQCKQALVLACKMLVDTTKNVILEMDLTRASESIYQHFDKQFKSLETVARTCIEKSREFSESVRLVAGLLFSQITRYIFTADRKKHEMAKMEVEQQELIARAEKAAKESEALRMELEKLRTRTSKDDREAAGLRRLLAQADVDLCSLRASNIELTEKVTDLEEQLTKWIAYGECVLGLESHGRRLCLETAHVSRQKNQQFFCFLWMVRVNFLQKNR